jgi:hypothetical protein
MEKSRYEIRDEKFQIRNGKSRSGKEKSRAGKEKSRSGMEKSRSKSGMKKSRSGIQDKKIQIPYLASTRHSMKVVLYWERPREGSQSFPASHAVAFHPTQV